MLLLTPGGCNSRYVNWEVPPQENFFDPVLEKYLLKDIPVLNISRLKVYIR